MPERILILVMGPAGSGKSTVAAALSHHTGWPMIEADDHHPQANLDKMEAGIALSDKDRAGWIDSLAQASRAAPAPKIILACSALTPYVQDRLLAEADRKIVWLLLAVPKPVLFARMTARTEHFMPASLLEDQLENLSPPDDAITIEADRPVDRIVSDMLKRIGHIPFR